MDRLPSWPARALTGAIAVLPLGFVGGLAGMHAVLDVPALTHDPMFGGPERFVVGASIVAALSAIAGALGSLPRRPILVFLATAGLTLGVSLICAPLTYLALAEGGGGHGPADLLFAVVVVGALMAAPFGLAFAGAYAPLVALMRWARERDAAVSRASSWLFAGVWWAIAGTALAHLGGANLQITSSLSVADLLSALGLALVLACAARLVWIAIWLDRVARGRASGWALEPAGAAHASLAPVLPWGPNDGVIVRVHDAAAGPFRSGEARVALWRASLPRH